MKNYDPFSKILFRGLLLLPLLFLSCEEDKPKCTRDSVERSQDWLVFWNIDDYATINADGTIEYLLSLGFLEVCSYESMTLESCIGMKTANPAVNFSSFVRVRDVDGAIGLDWTPMKYDAAYNRYCRTEFNVEFPTDKQETIIWVDIKLTVPPQNLTVDEIHYQMSFEMFNYVQASLWHHKPNY